MGFTDVMAAVQAMGKWVDEAACAGLSEDWFFPYHSSATLDAKSVCARCPVLTECRTHGLKYERFGIWGGLSPSERDEIRKRHGITVEELVA